MLHIKANRLAAAWVWYALGTAMASGQAATPLVFKSPNECVTRHRLSERLCAGFSQRAWEMYVANVARFATHKACASVYSVCVVLPPQWLGLEPVGGQLRPVIRFVPPLRAISIEQQGDDYTVSVLIDEPSRPLSTLDAARALPSGLFVPTPAMLQKTYEEVLRHPAPAAPAGRRPRGDAANADNPRGNPLEALTQEDIYPVPANRRRPPKPSKE